MTDDSIHIFHYRYSFLTSAVVRINRFLASSFRLSSANQSVSKHKNNPAISLFVLSRLTRQLYIYLRRLYLILFICPDPTVYSTSKIIKVFFRIFSTSKPDLIIATFPYSAPLLAAQFLSKQHSIPWIADMRDSWNNDHRITDPILRSHIRSIESSVLYSASHVVSISSSLIKRINTSGTPLSVISNSYDDYDNSISLNPDIVATNHLSIAYTGTFDFGYLVDPFLDFIRLFATGRIPELLNCKITFTGIGRNWQYFHELTGLSTTANLQLNLLPETTQQQCRKLCHCADLLLVFGWSTEQGRAVLTGKVFDYLAYKKPVLAISYHNHDLAKFVERYRLGCTAESLEQLITFFSSLQHGRHEFFSSFPSPDTSLIHRDLSATSNSIRYSKLIQSLLINK